MHCRSFTLKLTFHKFNTKCEKQYLYVFDGDSVFHPLIGSFSGSLQTAGTLLNFAMQSAGKLTPFFCEFS